MNEELLKKLVEKMVEERKTEVHRIEEERKAVEDEIEEEARKLFNLINISYEITDRYGYQVGNFNVASQPPHYASPRIERLSGTRKLVVTADLYGKLHFYGRTKEELINDLNEVKTIRPMLEEAIREELLRQNEITEEMKAE